MYKKKLGTPIGFDISTLNKFKKIKGDFGAKYMVKRLKNKTNFIEVRSKKIFRDFDKISDFRRWFIKFYPKNKKNYNYN